MQVNTTDQRPPLQGGRWAIRVEAVGLLLHILQIEDQIKLKCVFNCDEITHFLGDELIAVASPALPGNPDL